MSDNPAICSNCGATEHYRYYKKARLCSACYQFQRYHGRPRTEQDHRVKGGSTGICIICGQTWATAKNRCGACHKYLRVFGKDRTRRLWSRPEQCKNCGKPRTAQKDGIVRGRCAACMHYYRRHGVERPESFWKAPFGWCDCGQKAAIRDVVLKVMSLDKKKIYEEHYNLCNDCYKAEFGKLPPAPTKKEKPHGKLETAHAPAEVTPRPGVDRG